MTDVLSSNIFSLLEDGNEDSATLATKHAEAQAKAKVAAASAAGKEAAAAATAKAATAARPQSAQARRPDGPGRGDRGRGGRGRGEGRGDRPPRTEEADNGFESGSPTERGGRGRGEGRGRGGRGRGEGRGERRPYEGRGGEGGERPPRRQFDRHSGTGRGTEVSKRGAGKGNWGSDAEAATNPEEQALKVEDPAAEPKAEAVEGDAAIEPAEPTEEEIKELSLEEYETALLEKKKAMGWVSEAKPKEVDMAQFADMKAYARQSPEEEMAGIELSKKKEKAAKTEKAKTDKTQPAATKLTPSFTVAADDNTRYEERGGRGGRGGRGTGRGGRGRGDGPAPPRGGGGRSGPAPNVADESAFPNLGA